MCHLKLCFFVYFFWFFKLFEGCFNWKKWLISFVNAQWGLIYFVQFYFFPHLNLFLWWWTRTSELVFSGTQFWIVLELSSFFWICLYIRRFGACVMMEDLERGISIREKWLPLKFCNGNNNYGEFNWKDVII